MVDATEAHKRRYRKKEWRNTLLEVGKWALIIWLIWPLREASSGPIMFGRVALGILLFVIFAGKLFYDTVIHDIIRQKRTTAKQDVVTLIGMVVGVAVIVGLVIAFVGFLIIEYLEMARSGEDASGS